MTASILYDIVVVLAVLCMVLWSAKQGFIRTVINFAGYLISTVAAFAISNALSQFIYNSFIRDGLIHKIEESIINVTSQQDLILKLQEWMDKIPKMFQGLFTADGVQGIVDSFNGSVSGTANAITDVICAPIIENGLRVILFFLVFFVLLGVVKGIARVTGLVNHVPVIGQMNALLGGLFGLLKAVILLWIFAFLLHAAIALLAAGGDSTSILSEEAIQKTYLFKYFYNSCFLIQF